MKFPSPEYDNAVAAACHGTIGDERLSELHELLRTDADARDEYLWRVEVHGELASSICKELGRVRCGGRNGFPRDHSRAGPQ